MKRVTGKCDTERGGVVLALIYMALVAVVGVSVLAFVFGYVVEPGFVGVRQITLGPGQGFSEKGLRPGYHWSIPWYSKVHFVPQTIQSLHLSRNDYMHPDTPGPLEVQTTDGSSVLADVSVLYYFYPEAGMNGELKHGGPAELLQTVGVVHDWGQHIQTIANNECRKALGSLSTSDFYDPELRESMVLKAQDEMNKRLAEAGIGVEAVLLRRYTYAEERITQEIFEKNLQDQEERYNQAASRLATVRAHVEQLSADWDAQIKTLSVKGQNEVRVKASEADLYEARQTATGDLAVAKAKAEVDRLKAGILAQSKGAHAYVAREMAPLVGSLKGGIVTDVDPYDFRDWMEKFGFKEGDR